MKKFAIISITIASIGLAGPVYADVHKEMHDAICDRNLTKVKRLVARGYNINRPMGEDGGYALNLASYCYGGAANVANYLLDRGASVNPPVKSGYSPLLWALRSSDGEGDSFHKVAVRMIKNGANVNFQDKTTGRTALMGAAGNGDATIVRLLLQRGANKNKKTRGNWCISSRQDIQCTAAMHARLDGHVMIALSLEDKSTTAYERGLNYAIIKGNTSQALGMIKGGANVNAKEDLSGFTALQYATRHKRYNIMQALLKAGANPNAKLAIAGTTALREAIVRYDHKGAKILIDGGAKGNNRQTQGCGGGMSEWDWAVSYGLNDTARYMVEKGAVNVRKPGAYGSEGLFGNLYGRNKDHVDMAEFLIGKGYRGKELDVDHVATVYNKNSWMQKSPYSEHNRDIQKILKDSMNKPAPVVPEIEEEKDPDGPEFPEEETGEVEVIDPWAVKSRSVNQKKGRAFKMIYENNSNPKRARREASTDRLPLD